jgi:hypothetical protein
MGVDRLPSGSYRVRLMVDGRKHTAAFPTEEEAREWEVVTRGRVVGVRAARTLTVREYTRRWLDELIDTAADIDRCRRDVAEHITPTLGSRPLAEVTPVEIVAPLEQVRADAFRPLRIRCGRR